MAGRMQTVVADDVWLSMACDRSTGTLSVHQDVRTDEAEYLKSCEETFLSSEGRPHWGKVNDLDDPQMMNAHPRWREWWPARDQ